MSIRQEMEKSIDSMRLAQNRFGWNLWPKQPVDDLVDDCVWRAANRCVDMSIKRSLVTVLAPLFRGETSIEDVFAVSVMRSLCV